MLTVYLRHPQVQCFNFLPRHTEQLQRALPEKRICICRSREEFLKALPETQTALVWYFRQEWFSQAPRLQRILTPAAGKDLLGAVPPPGVTLHFSGYHGTIMAETAAAMILASCRSLPLASSLSDPAADNPWPRGPLAGSMTTLRNSHVTILGMGRIGTAAAKKLKAFGPRITGIRRTPVTPETPAPAFFTPGDTILPPSELPSVLPDTDHLLLILPRTPQTENVIGARELQLLPGHAVLYNLGRGNAVNEEALVNALTSHRQNPKTGIAFSWLDVFQQEPLPADSPLRRQSNCRLMPHTAAAAPDYMDLFVQEAVETLQGRL